MFIAVLYLLGLTNLHEDSRVIVSCLPDEQRADGSWLYFYGCETTLRLNNVPRVVVDKVDIVPHLEPVFHSTHKTLLVVIYFT